jgi:hypothetical protein
MSDASVRLQATLGYHSMPSLLVASPSKLIWRVSDNVETKELLTNAKGKLGLLRPVITKTAEKDAAVNLARGTFPNPKMPRDEGDGCYLV